MGEGHHGATKRIRSCRIVVVPGIFAVCMVRATEDARSCHEVTSAVSQAWGAHALDPEPTRSPPVYNARALPKGTTRHGIRFPVSPSSHMYSSLPSHPKTDKDRNPSILTYKTSICSRSAKSFREWSLSCPYKEELKKFFVQIVEEESIAARWVS